MEPGGSGGGTAGTGAAGLTAGAGSWEGARTMVVVTATMSGWMPAFPRSASAATACGGR